MNGRRGGGDGGDAAVLAENGGGRTATAALPPLGVLGGVPFGGDGGPGPGGLVPAGVERFGHHPPTVASAAARGAGGLSPRPAPRMPGAGRAPDVGEEPRHEGGGSHRAAYALAAGPDSDSDGGRAAPRGTVEAGAFQHLQGEVPDRAETASAPPDLEVSSRSLSSYAVR
eukprot:TRINITY_DN2194_c0_g1_i2.p3 TRINITY_DN2194_c0_g1~~TRINITY_DN2194_c0_g1_i2.p3  ORF type:complete len:170 (-),score=26.51 TRINITY_DN2194_c0_g1_i2:1146-1655(-)